jgi:hypothetical protein
MNIAFFGAEEDRPYLTRLKELTGVSAFKISLAPDEYITSIAAKVRSIGADTIIVSNQTTLLTLMKTQPDFKQPRDKRGTLRKLSLDDFAGSCFTIPASKMGTPNDITVLCLGPASGLVRTPEGYFLFKRYISKLTKPKNWFPQTAFTWEVWTPSTSEKLLSLFSRAKLIAIDIETYVGDIERRIHCVGYCALFEDGTTHTVVVPFKDTLAHYFVKRLNATLVPKIFQNGMYDNLYFLRWNCPCNAWYHDTLHLFHSWYSELPKRLDFITAFSVRLIRFWKDDAHGGNEHDMFEYNARDCWATLNAYCSLLLEVPQWAKDNYLMEFPLVFPCLHMEADGLSLDKAKFDAGKAAIEDSIKVEIAKLSAWFGADFNPGSPDQCKRLLTVLGMQNVESADSKAMINCASLHPFNELIVSTILSYRKKAKLLSTYFKWEKFWGGRLYYKTNPAGTETGRMASTESSYWTGLQIQNIPQGKAVKSWIMADEGWLLAEGDFAQSEARCVGYMSGCPALIDLVEGEYDYHSWNAHAFFGIPYKDVTKDFRQLAKRVGHGANYNMGPAVLLETMGPKEVAKAKALLKLPAKLNLTQVCQHLLNTYSKAYPEVKIDWYDNIKRAIALTHKLVSPFGHTRYFFGNPIDNKPVMNACVAHGPQNLSGAVLNKVFYSIWHSSLYGELRGKVRLKAQIHDSIFYGYKGEDTPETVRKMMTTTTPVTDVHKVTRQFTIPVDMNSGGTAWSDLK